jgi:hypothetical protein
MLKNSVADTDPVPMQFYCKDLDLDLGSGMIFFRIPDLRSRILTTSQIQYRRIA